MNSREERLELTQHGDAGQAGRGRYVQVDLAIHRGIRVAGGVGVEEIAKLGKDLKLSAKGAIHEARMRQGNRKQPWICPKAIWIYASQCLMRSFQPLPIQDSKIELTTGSHHDPAILELRAIQGYRNASTFQQQLRTSISQVICFHLSQGFRKGLGIHKGPL